MPSIHMKNSAWIVGSLAGLLLATAPSFAKNPHSSHSAGTHHAQRQQHNPAPGVQRDSNGRIKRDPKARKEFQKQNPCPSTGKTSGKCPGYVVDHVQPLKRGGSDTRSNMQWQTKEAAKAKDKIE